MSEDGTVVLAQEAKRALTEFEQAGRVAGALVIGFDLFVLAGLELGALDLAHLEAQQVELLGVSFFIDDECGFLCLQFRAGLDERGKLSALRLQLSERVENGELPRGLEKRLVLVRPVHVHEPLAERGQRGQSRGRAVDELTVRARRREGALDDELMFFARFQPVLVEESLERRAQLAHVEGGFNRATVRATADERAVGPLAEGEVERADDDGLARAGLAGDGVVAGLEFQRQVGDEREVFDSQRGEHGERLREAGRCGKVFPEAMKRMNDRVTFPTP